MAQAPNGMKTILALLAGAIWLTVGCRTTPVYQPPQPVATLPKVTTPASPSGDVKKIITGILNAHHFAPPIFMTGEAGVTYAVAARPHSETAVELASITLRATGEVKVQITCYRRIPTDWAILGRVFTGSTDQEAQAMEQSLRNKLQP